MKIPALPTWLTTPLRRALVYATSGWRRQALTAAFVLLTVAVIAQILWVNRETLQNYDWQIRPVWLLWALLFFLIDFFAAVWAWHLLVSRLAGFADLRRTTKIYLQSNLAKRIPGSVWYVASRAVLYEEAGISKVTVSLLSGLELAFFIVSGVATTLLTLPFWALPDAMSAALGRFWLLGLLVPLCALLVHPRVLERLWRRFSQQGEPPQLQWRDTISWLGVYILTWILGAFVLFSVMNLFTPTPWSQLVMLTGMWSLATTISLMGVMTISLVGLREVSLALLLTQVVPAPVTVIIVITIRLIWLSGELLTALWAMRL